MLLVKAIENFIETGKGKADLEYISTQMSEVIFDPEKIREKFESLIQANIVTKIKKALAMMEYLTGTNPEEFATIISGDKFFDSFQLLIFDPDLESTCLNLLKLWSETYAHKLDELSNLHGFIGNLNAFEMYLPDEYVSEIDKNLDNSTSDGYNILIPSYTNKNDELNQQEYDTSKNSFNELLMKANNHREQVQKLENDRDFNDHPVAYKSSTLNALKAKNMEILRHFQAFYDSPTWSDFQSLIGDSIVKIEEIRSKLAKKLNDIEEMDSNQAVEMVPTITRNTSSNDYRIEITPSTRSENVFSKQLFEYMQSFKTQPCPKGNDCLNSPMHISKDYIPVSDLKCRLWHDYKDLRRPPLLESGYLSYKSSRCRLGDDCQDYDLDMCEESHNLYEELFHPFKFKTIKCRNPDDCDMKRECPYYHTEHEREAWIMTLQTEFASKKSKTETSSDFESETFSINLSKVNSKVEDDTVLFGDSKEKQGNGGFESKEISGASYQSNMNLHFNPFKKILCSKLIIKRIYIDPGRFSQLFQIQE